jgi:tetratricopeptide (TPR) repeat protein
MAPKEPKRRNVVEKLSAEKSVVAERIGTVIMQTSVSAPPPADALAPPHKPPRNLPPRNDKFVGRTTELDQIHKRLNQKHEIGVTQQAAAHGLGGVGKTSVAIEYAWNHIDDYPGGLFILLCDRDLILPEIVNLAGPLGMEESETPEQTAHRIKQHLESAEPSLLILDNVRSAAQFNDAEWSRYLPAGRCRRLITTRAATLGPSIPMYPIERLPRDQGIDLIAQFRPDAAADENKDIVGDIVDWFDGLAVGLTVVAVYMSLHEHVAWPGYSDSLEKKGLGAVRQSHDIIDRTAGGLPEHYERRIDAVFDETVDALDEPHRRALEYAALLPEDTAVNHWLTWLLENDDTIELPDTPGYESNRAAPIVAQLVQLRLLRPLEGEQDVLSLHRVLHRRLEERLAPNPDHTSALLDRLVELAELRGKASHAAVTDKSLRPELTALLRLTNVFLNHHRLTPAAGLANWVTTPLHDLARFQENRTSLLRFVRDDACILEPYDPEQAAALLSNLAMILQDLGDVPEARCYMDRAIQIDEKHFDPDHPNLAVRYSNLATILKDLGDLPQARRHMQRAIEINQKHFDPDHPTLAVSYNNLAHVELASGRKSEACNLWRRAYRIATRHFDAAHPHVQVIRESLETHCGGVPNNP